MPGTVVTFYSYKGGVGRTFALANIAVLLARWGYRVLCVDWDLEAPGLDAYLRPMLATPPAGGVVDLVDDFRAEDSRSADHVTRVKDVGGTLDFMAAGRDDATYVERLQLIDWAWLYDEGFGDYLEQRRKRWVANYDFVLVDSRTGVSDTAGICTAHLPDRLVLLFTANLQNLRGAVDMAGRANEARDKLPYDRPQLTVLPVLSRFDTRVEYDRSDEWRRRCLDETKGLYRNWLDSEVPAETMARHLTLPYVSHWSFGEQLAVRAEETPTPDQLGFALETVAAVVAHGFGRTDLLAENRDTYVGAVRMRQRYFPYDVRVSTPRSTKDFADQLVDELRALDVRVALSLSGDRSLLARATDDARHLCLVIDETVSRWQTAQVDLFLQRTFGQNRRVIPVLGPDTDPNTLSGYIGNLRYLQFGPTYGPAQVARDLKAQLMRTTLDREDFG
jgi:hypothetical protein